MSHFTHIRTKMIQKEFIISALKDMGYSVLEGDIQISGYGGQKTGVEIKVPTKSSGYDIGFRKSGDSYELVADWWGIKDISQEDFVQQLTKRYAYNATMAKLEEKGFSLTKEELTEGNRIHIVLRRMV